MRWEQLQAEEEAKLQEEIIQDYREKSPFRKFEEDEDSTRTRNMYENEWRFYEQQEMKTKRKFESPIFCDENETTRNEAILVKDNTAEVNKEKETVERKLMLREIIDEIGAEIEEVRRKKLNDTPDFKKGNLSDRELITSGRSWTTGQARELGSILEEAEEETY